jgi:hypothetical protein
MEESFRREIERMVGLDIKNKVQKTSVHEVHDRQGFVPHGIIKNISTHIRTPLPIRTTGGIRAHPLFAAALLDRARTLPKDAAKETIILVAHSSGNDQQNEQWLQTLEAFVMHMRKQAVMNFVQSESQPGAKTGQISVTLGLKKFVSGLKKRKSKEEVRLLFLHGL